MLKNLKRNFMGVKSERTELKDYYERGLFNEAELGLHDEETLFEEHAEKVSISSHTRRSRGRKKLPEDLERKVEWTTPYFSDSKTKLFVLNTFFYNLLDLYSLN